MERKQLSLTLCIALALAGCSTLQAPMTPALGGVQAPAAWVEAPAKGAQRDASDLAVWWRRFGDSTLDRLIADALAANTDIAQAQASLHQARALADVQSAQLLPALGGSASAQRSKSGSLPAANNFRAGLDASWELDLFGGQRSAANASTIDAQASAASLGDVQVSVAAEVALAYLSLRSSEAREDIAQRNLASQQETLQITQWRVQAGLATSLDAEQARAAVEQTRAQVPLLQKAAAQSRHQLALLTGRSSDQIVLAKTAVLPAAPAQAPAPAPVAQPPAPPNWP